MNYSIRKYEYNDGNKVVDIFNYFVENDFSAFPDKPIGYEYAEMFEKMTTGYPYYVIETDAKEIIGFAWLHPFHHAGTFKRTAEITYFILTDHTRKGLGSKVMSLMLSEAVNIGIDKILARISSKNQKSLDFHFKNGFYQCGCFKAVGKKFNTDFDMI
ncbi:MAG: hypothetical protein A2V66_13900, partial [Ignavibacteria bacterium RBG_13_36_8]